MTIGDAGSSYGASSTGYLGYDVSSGQPYYVGAFPEPKPQSFDLSEPRGRVSFLDYLNDRGDTPSDATMYKVLQSLADRSGTPEERGVVSNGVKENERYRFYRQQGLSSSAARNAARNDVYGAAAQGGVAAARGGMAKPRALDTMARVESRRMRPTKGMGMSGAPMMAKGGTATAACPECGSHKTMPGPHGMRCANCGHDLVSPTKAAKGGVLNAAQRNAMPGSTFGLPGQRKYPMPDRSHAANAKARATQQVKAGNLTPAQKAQIDAKANKVLRAAKGGTVKAAPGGWQGPAAGAGAGALLAGLPGAAAGAGLGYLAQRYGQNPAANEPDTISVPREEYNSLMGLPPTAGTGDFVVMPTSQYQQFKRMKANSARAVAAKPSGATYKRGGLASEKKEPPESATVEAAEKRAGKKEPAKRGGRAAPAMAKGAKNVAGAQLRRRQPAPLPGPTRQAPAPGLLDATMRPAMPAQNPLNGKLTYQPIPSGMKRGGQAAPKASALAVSGSRRMRPKGAAMPKGPHMMPGGKMMAAKGGTVRADKGGEARYEPRTTTTGQDIGRAVGWSSKSEWDPRKTVGDVADSLSDAARWYWEKAKELVGNDSGGQGGGGATQAQRDFLQSTGTAMRGE